MTGFACSANAAKEGTVGNVLSLAAVVISIIAVAISMLFGFRQVRLMRHANYVPAIVDLVTEFRSAQFNDHFRYVCERLQEDHSSELGISSLPDEARTAVYDVAYYLSTFATLSTLRIIKPETLLALFHNRIFVAWAALEPFVIREREVGSAGRHLLALLESFVTRYNGRVDESVAKLVAEQLRA